MISDPTALRNLRQQLSATVRKVLTPPPNLSLSEWANENRVIGVGAGPLPGPYRWQTAPYQKELLDTAGDIRTRKMVLCMAAQTAKTTVVENIIAYFMACDPSPVMLVLPSERDAEIFSTTRLDTMIADTPCLKTLIKSKSTKDSGDTRFQKRFHGGSLELISAKSPSSFRGRSIRVMLCDEVDGYENTINEEGSPVDLAEKRTTTFWDRKFILTSTPTDLSVSRIWPEFLGGDQRYFYVPCPTCGHFQQLKFFYQLKWENDDPTTVYYECIDCGYHIREYHKHSMLSKGEWRAHTPDNPYPSFHLNALYSPLKDWETIVSEWLKVKGDHSSMKTFINLVLGEPWEDKKSKTTLEQLMEKAHKYDAPCPTGVGVLTAGVDVQRDRLEVAIWGWGHGEEAWLIDSHVIQHDPSNDAAWAELSRIIGTRYDTPSGKTIGLSAVAIDSGFATDFVYRYVSNYANPKVFAVKGSGTPGSRLISRVRHSTHKKNQPFYDVGTITAKDQIFLSYQNPPGPRSFHFPDDVEREVLEQLLSEVKVTKYKNMRPYDVWEPKSSSVRNEMLDCLVYALAALAFLNIYGDLQRLADGFKAVGSAPVPQVSPSAAPSPTLTTAAIQPKTQQKAPRFTYKPRFKPGSGW